jgi:hypothetical protein
VETVDLIDGKHDPNAALDPNHHWSGWEILMVMGKTQLRNEEDG